MDFATVFTGMVLIWAAVAFWIARKDQWPSYWKFTILFLIFIWYTLMLIGVTLSSKILIVKLKG